MAGRAHPVAAVITDWSADELLHLFLVFLFCFGAFTTITQVGKERKPITGGMAATIVLVQGFIIAALIVWWPT